MDNFLIYKNQPPTNRFAIVDDHDDLLEQQNLIFSQLQESDDNNRYMLLEILSETLTIKLKNINPNFYSKWFIDLIQNSLNPKNPVLMDICIIIITKLILIFNFEYLTCFTNEQFIDKYFELLNYFNSNYLNQSIDERNDDSIISLRINLMRLISLIASNDVLIDHCKNYLNQIITLLNQTNNDTLILLYLSFIVYILKYANKINIEEINPFDFNVQTIIKLIDSQNKKIKLISIEIFNQYLIFSHRKQEVAVLTNILPFVLPNFIAFLDDDSYEVVSSSLRVFETLYSINLDNSSFNQVVYNKLMQLFHHHSSTVRYSTVKCILAFVSNYDDQYNSINELMTNLIFIGKKEGIELQTFAACALANIIIKSIPTNLHHFPIQDILIIFVHILESENLDSFNLIFAALNALIDAIEKFSIDIKVLQPLIDFNFDNDFLLENVPDQVDVIKSRMNKYINKPGK